MKSRIRITNKQINSYDYIGAQYSIDDRLWTVFRVDPDDPTLFYVKANTGEVGTVGIKKLQVLLSITL